MICTSFFMLVLATLLSWINIPYESYKLSSFGKRSVAIAFLCTTAFLIIRWIQTKHLPPSNLYESSLFLSWSFSLSYIISKIRNQNEWSGAIAAPSATLTHAFATWGLPGEMQESTLLVPALQSHRLMMHVSTTLSSYAILLCGSLSAMSLPIIFRGTVNRRMTFNSSGNSDFYAPILRISGNHKQVFFQKAFYLLSSNSRKCQLINQLDRLTYQAISLGFIFLTIGILSGAVWANEAWGSYWSWDPKETWALVTWLIHATYLHIKITKSWGGEGPSVMASTGFFPVWVCFLGVNLSGIGLHNYGWLIQK
uniref:Cytochrome c biogenesis protein CcsA n=1 Tax=Lindsaea linearis TaxID=641179 RepID=A0A5B9RLP9_9MONI|nr:cytochrome c heme attachment protein [Lindsaea linearis]QEG57397.1 cytochrome c heme attachment protein [Lindsaea linearis]